MKQIILLLILSSIVFSEDVSFKEILEQLSTWANVQMHTLYFRQRLDHFNPANHQKWNQRYWVSATYYRKAGPAFLFINGEVIIESFNFEMFFPNSWLAYAKEVNAICFSLDHRFYGESWPENETVTHLNTRQALADIDNFIKSMTKEFKFKSIKWIVFGCSYSGTLATWARLKYPHLIHGAVASSAPLLATANYVQYSENVERSLKAYNPKCLESISSAVEEIASYVKMNQKIKIERNISFNTSIFEIMSLLWHARPEYMDPMDVLFEMVHTFNSLTQRNKIPTVCDTMMNYEGSKVQAYFELDKKTDCQQALSAPVALKNYVDNPEARISACASLWLFLCTTFTALTDYAPILKIFICYVICLEGWDYQRCSELGLFLSYNTTTYLSSVFHLFTTFEDHVKQTCYPFFGSSFSLRVLNENVQRTNSLYGGLDINVDRMIFIHGSLDPWHPLGLYEKKNGSLYETIFIEGTSHCTDIYRASDKDIPALKNARIKIIELLKSWLK